MKVLLTGGAGYIGSHTAAELINEGHDVLIIDNYYNSEPDVILAIEKITGYMCPVYEADVCDYTAVAEVFASNDIDAVIHFAGYKAVGESVENPLDYYENNLNSLICVSRAMNEYGVKNIIFSSSATVYGMNNQVPFDETMPTSCTNPYGWTKLMCEQILRDAAVANGNLSVVLLRYFNPVGAHESGLIGEKPSGIPNNLMPYIQQVAAGIREKLSVFGDDYDTPDGTGVRDYIHVVDLAIGHAKALNFAANRTGVETINLGTGCGYSVLDVVKTFEAVNKIEIPYVIAPRRAGDIAECYANPEKAEQLLGWKAERSLEEMCKDAWRWEKRNK